MKYTSNTTSSKIKKHLLDRVGLRLIERNDRDPIRRTFG